MPDRSSDISYFARTNTRHPFRTFGIRQADRLHHCYIIGKTGAGKTTLLETLIVQDILSGRGLALVDPHGDLAARIAAGVPAHRQQDLIYFNAADPTQPYGYNPLQFLRPEQRPLAASGFLEVFKTMWHRYWGVRMEHVLRNALLALLDQPRASMADIPRLLRDKAYRREVLARVENEQVRAFWEKEYDNYSYRYRADSIAPVQNKVGAFLADPRLYRLLTSPEQPLRLRSIMDEGKILLVNLARGEFGSDSAELLGGLLVTSIGLAAFSRAKIPEHERKDFFLYLDEFQNVTTLSTATMTSELRKYGVGLILAHQYLDQLEPDVRHAVIGNAGTLISFRLGAKDAEFIAHEFEPVFDRIDLVNLPNYHIYLKLLIDGAPSKPFSAVTFPPI